MEDEEDGDEELLEEELLDDEDHPPPPPPPPGPDLGDSGTTGAGGITTVPTCIVMIAGALVSDPSFTV